MLNHSGCRWWKQSGRKEPLSLWTISKGTLLMLMVFLSFCLVPTFMEWPLMSREPSRRLRSSLVRKQWYNECPWCGCPMSVHVLCSPQEWTGSALTSVSLVGIPMRPGVSFYLSWTGVWIGTFNVVNLTILYPWLLGATRLESMCTMIYISLQHCQTLQPNGSYCRRKCRRSWTTLQSLRE